LCSQLRPQDLPASKSGKWKNHDGECGKRPSGGAKTPKRCSTVFGPETLLVFDVSLAENAFTPITGVPFLKVAKKLRFFSTFCVHPRLFVCFLTRYR
jgi:hypothetical protein